MSSPIDCNHRQYVRDLAEQAGSALISGGSVGGSLERQLNDLDPVDTVRVCWFVYGVEFAQTRADNATARAVDRDRAVQLRHDLATERARVSVLADEVQRLKMNYAALALLTAVLALLLFVSVQVGNDRTANTLRMEALNGY